MKLVDKKILKYKRVVYYGFSRDEKILELAKEFGATHTINTSKEDVRDSVKK